MIDLKGKKVLVVGLGASGFAAAQLLAEKGAQVKMTESSEDSRVGERLKKLSRRPIQYEIGGHTPGFCSDAELVVASPGVSAGSLPLRLSRSRGVPVVGEMELGSWFCPAPIVAITGTNGKSTTTELIGKILSLSGLNAVVCGNIGKPLCGEVGELTNKSVAVVEVSSFQLETIRSFKAHVAVLLNIAEDHYERHGGYESYRAEKLKIFNNQDENDWAVIHSDFFADEALKDLRSRKVYFGAGEGEAAIERDRIVADAGGGKSFVIEKFEISLEGRHNLDNVAASILAARIMGAGNEYIREGIATFRGLDHRFERVDIFEGVEFIDDSKATNIDATKRALESLDGRVVLIAGGRDKGGDYLSILPLIRDKVKAMVLIGEARDRIKEAFSTVVPVFSAETMGEAVGEAHSLAGKGDYVVLSPMCSSFDMFSDYKERGEVFQQEILKLKKGKPKSKNTHE